MEETTCKYDYQDWAKHKLLIIDNLGQLKKEQTVLAGEIRTITKELQVIKSETQLWDALAAIIPMVVLMVIAYLKFHKFLKN